MKKKHRSGGRLRATRPRSRRRAATRQPQPAASAAPRPAESTTSAADERSAAHLRVVANILAASARSRAASEADHWRHLYVRGKLMVKLAREPRVLDLFERWRGPLRHRIASDYLALPKSDRTRENAYQTYVQAIAELSLVALPAITNLIVGQLGRKEWVCLGPDLVWAFVSLFSAELGMPLDQLCSTVGGNVIARSPEFVFQDDPKDPTTRARLLEAYELWSQLPPPPRSRPPGTLPRNTPQTLDKYVDWYWRRTVDGASERGVAKDSRAQRSGVRRGVREVERLLALSTVRLAPGATPLSNNEAPASA